MKMSLPMGSMSLVLILFGCSTSHPVASTRTPGATPQASSAPANGVASSESTAPLPKPSAGELSLQPWRPELINDHMGGAIVLKRTSVDGKYDLVVLEKGAVPFLSFAKHDKWDAVHDQPAKGKLMDLRFEFENGKEEHAEWDELGYGTENLRGVLWSYPVSTDSVGGDQRLIQEMVMHRAMVLEIEPGVTTQFDLTGLANEMKKVRGNQPEPTLEARQGAE
jgi:hypothetical protein